MPHNTTIMISLLDLLSKRNEMEIHDYYVISLIKDVCANMSELDIKFTSNIDLNILESYLEDCKNSKARYCGLVITSSNKKESTIKNYILSIEDLISELASMLPN